MLFEFIKLPQVQSVDTDFRTRFLVVRHPFERLLSCYRDKFEKANKEYYYDTYGRKMIRMFRKRSQNISFQEVSYVVHVT